MKSAEILELIRAGYTKEEIAAMDGAQAPVEVTPETDPEPDEDQNNDDSDTAPLPEISPDKNVAEMEAIKAQINEQTKELKQLRDQLIANKINTGAKGTPPSENNIYDVWADALNK